MTTSHAISSTHHDKFELVAGRLCLDFCNTINFALPQPNERVKTFEDLLLWSRMTDVLDKTSSAAVSKWADQHPKAANAAVLKAREFRATLHRIFVDVSRGSNPAAFDMDQLNKRLSIARSHQKIVLNQHNFRLDWQDLTGLDQILWPIAISAADVLTGSDINQVHQCSGSGCSWLFMDETRNHSRRWCSMEVCGNRAKAKRHYGRSQN